MCPVAAGAHFFDANKMSMSPPEYMTVQKIYARWSFFGIAVIAALVLILTYTFMLRSDRSRINLLLLFSFPLANAAAQSPAPMNRIDLYSGWTVQTSRKVQATGDSISRPKFQTKGWYRTSVPMTVVAVQVAAGEFPEPYYGMNRHGGEIGRMNADPPRYGDL
jgi:hypothetical protein